MSNSIDITWNSNQQQLMADMRKRQLLQDEEIARLKQVIDAANKSGVAYSNAAKAAQKSLAEQKAAALSLDLQKRTALAENAKKEREEAVKSLAAQKAAALSLDLQKRTALAENSRLEREAAAKLMAEQKAAALSLGLQKRNAIEENIRKEREEAVKSLAAQKAAALSLDLQKRTALAENARLEREAAAKSLADQKATALALEQQQQSERQKQSQFYLERRRFWEQQSAAEEEAAAKSKARKDKEAADERSRQSAFYQNRMRQREEEAAADRAAQRAAADQVRRSLMTERELARTNFRERMRQLWDLRRQGGINDKEYDAAAKKALETWRQASSVDMSKVWSMVPGQLASVLTLTGAVAGGIRLVTAEMENLKKVQEDAKNAHMTFAEAQSEAVQNLDATMTGQQLTDEVMKIARETGVSPTVVMRAASGALGARGDATAKEAMGAIRESIDFNPFPGQQQASTNTATAILAQKVVDSGATFKQILGQQKSAKIASPVTKDDDFAHYVVPMATSAGSFHDTTQRAYGLGAYLGTRMSDTAGRVSSTAATDLMRDLETHSGLQNVKVEDGDATYSRLRAIAFDPAYRNVQATLLGKLHAQSQDELVKSGGKLTTEARAYGAIADLISGNKEQWNLFEEKRKEILPLDKSAEDLVDTQRKELAGLSAQKVARAELRAEAGTENQKLKNTPGARTAAARKALKDKLEAAGVPAMNQWVAGQDFDWGTWWSPDNPELRAAQTMESSASALNARAAETFNATSAAMLREAANDLRAAAAEQRANAAQYNQPVVNVQVQMPGGDERPAPLPQQALGAGGR